MILQQGWKLRRGVVAVCLFLCVGCGGKEDLTKIRAAVKGTVKLDGKPLKQGSILFQPEEGTKGPASGATIKDGAFEMTLEQGAAIGENRIEIRSPQPTGKQIKSINDDKVMVAEVAETIPDKYNSRSKLTQSIKAGKNEVSFDLESK